MAAASDVKVAEVKKLVAETAQAAASRPAAAVPAQARVAMENGMEQVSKTTGGLFKAAEEAAEFGRGNVEAVAKATQVYVAGVQDLGKQAMAVFQGLTDQAVEGAKALSTVRSLKEAAEIHATLTRSAIERSITETAKLQEAALKLAEQSFAPLSARMTIAVEKFASVRPLAA